MGLLLALTSRGTTVGAATAKALADAKQTLGSMEMEDRLETVKMCRVDKMYDATKKRITFNISDGALRKTIISALNQTGAVHKQAPASFMEREMQDWLEKLVK